MRKNKLIFIALSIASIFDYFHVTANENIIVDDKLKTDLTVEIKDGTEHIHIEKANENDISHNYYQKFNISKKGAFLENTNDLAAKIIVNEVTSAEKSLLRRKLTVNDIAAELIIANPNGIKYNGCRFVGSPNQRLVIGKVFYIEENYLTGFRNRGFNDVQLGEILLAIENGVLYLKLIVVFIVAEKLA